MKYNLVQTFYTVLRGPLLHYNTLYNIHHINNNCRTKTIKLKKTPHSSPSQRAMGCLLWVFRVKLAVLWQAPTVYTHTCQANKDDIEDPDRSHPGAHPAIMASDIRWVASVRHKHGPVCTSTMLIRPDLSVVKFRLGCAHNKPWL